MTRLLVIDDSPLMRRLVGAAFAGQPDFTLAFAADGAAALEQARHFLPDVITLDVNMPGLDGLACLDRLMLERPCPVVMLSALTEAGADATLAAMQLGAVDVIAKPAGAISLAMEEFGPLLVERVRAASRARVRRSLRLAERVRLQVGTVAAQPAPTPLLAGRAPADAVVLVGCSTGGPPALDALLSALPAGFPWPVLVAQHMPASFTAALARRLDRLCALEVVEVTRPLVLRPGLVCIGRGDADLVLAPRPGGPVAMAVPADPAYRWHPSVDRLVESALRCLPAPRLLGVLMTGMGDDGAATMTRLLQAGGRTIAEAESSAVVWGMPGELVRAGGAGVVLPLGRIGAQLRAWAA